MKSFSEFMSINGITREEIAAYLGVTESFISSIRTGRRQLPKEKLDIILSNPNWDTSMILDGDKECEDTPIVFYWDSQDRLNRFLKANRLKGIEIAEYLQISPAYFSHMLTGKSKLSKNKINQIINNPYGWDTSMLIEEGKNVIGNTQIGENNTISIESEYTSYLKDMIQTKEEEIKVLRTELSETRKQVTELLNLLKDSMK